MWEVVWDKAFGIASLLLALFFGVALGNVVRGVNLEW
jgi:cytochrome d ubiquinol oxidase subunit II